MAKNKDRVLITGGAGFLGINLTRYLLEKGYEIRTFDFAPFNYPEAKNIEEMHGDIRDKEKVSEAIKNVDVIVHTAAALPLYSPEDIYTTDVEGTRNLLEEAEKQGIKRFIHISSTAVYGIPDHHPLYEDDKLSGVGKYGECKIEAEKICVDFRKKGMIIPIIRPKSFIGPERLGVFAILYDWVKDGKNIPLLGDGNNRYQLLDVEDLCEAIYLVMTKDSDIVNDTYNIGAKEFTTMKEDYQVLIDEAGFGKRIIGFPAAPAILTLRILEFFKLSPLYKWVYETAATDSFVSTGKAEQKLGFKPKYSNKDALLRNYQWYLDNLESFEHSSGVSHRVPWKQGILQVVKIFF